MRESAPDVQRVSGDCKKKWRTESDFFSVFGEYQDGSFLGRKERYERKFGLYLNQSRIAYLQALPISVGIGAAIKGPGKEFVEALCENPLQVVAIMAKVEAEKANKNG